MGQSETNGNLGKYFPSEDRTAHAFHLESDPTEQRDLADSHPEELKRMLQFADQARADLGDSLVKAEGSGRSCVWKAWSIAFALRCMLHRVAIVDVSVRRKIRTSVVALISPLARIHCGAVLTIALI